MADCCSGTIHAGKPTGRVETVHNFPCYISDPPNNAAPKGVIVIIPDAFGWELPNSRVLADVYAKRLGCQVLLPEVMDGHHLDWSVLHDLDTMVDKDARFMSKILPGLKIASTFPIFLYRCRVSLVQPRLISFLSSVRSAAATTALPIGLAGFCWGGKFVFLLCSGADKDPPSQKPLVDCGFAAHPSNLALPADAEGVTIPMSVSAGSDDVVLSMTEVAKIERAFEGKGGAEKGFEVVVVKGAKHGFAIRGDPESEVEARHCQEGEDQAVNWFAKWLVGEAKGKV